MTVFEFMCWWLGAGVVSIALLSLIVYRDLKKEFQLGQKTGDSVSRDSGLPVSEDSEKYSGVSHPAEEHTR